MWNFGISDMLEHIDKLISILVLELSILDFKVVVLKFNGSSHFFLSLHLLLKLWQSWIYVIQKFRFELNNTCKVLFKGFQNGFSFTILKWDWNRRSLKNLFNNLIKSIFDGRCPFFLWEPLLFHPLCDCVAVSTQFYFILLSRKTFQLIFMWLLRM